MIALAILAVAGAAFGLGRRSTRPRAKGPLYRWDGRALRYVPLSRE